MTAPRWTLRVLGVAQDGGLPHAGCICPRCDAARAGRRPREKAACLGITDGRRVFLVDATPDLPDQLHAMGARRPDGIFLTHAHMGHYVGLAHLGKEALGVRDVRIHGTPQMGAFLASNAPWRALFDDGRCTFEAAAIDANGTRSGTDLGGLRARAIPVPHRQEYTDAVAWRFETDARAALWLPDIDSWDAWLAAGTDVRDVVRSVDVAWLDATFYAAGELGSRDMSEIPHPRVTETMDRLADLAPRVRLVHLNHTNPLWDDDGPARARGFRVAREGDVELL